MCCRREERAMLIKRLMVAVFGCVVVGALQGCIVQDIHDQIMVSNERLAAIDENFAKVERANKLLASLETQLDEVLVPVNENLGLIETRLASIDAKLEAIDRNLGSMDTSIESVEADLKSVSASLASLRKTINNIDSTIPFLKFSGDDEEEQAELEGGGEGSLEAGGASGSSLNEGSGAE